MSLRPAHGPPGHCLSWSSSPRRPHRCCRPSQLSTPRGYRTAWPCTHPIRSRRRLLH
nr:MAG TPA_asm: hypothetical protein [Caudoviricetes sp.]